MMKISVNLFATLVQFKPEGAGREPFEMECPEGTTIQNVLEMLNIPSFKARIIFVNNVHAAENTRLNNGDRVGIFPPVGGG